MRCVLVSSRARHKGVAREEESLSDSSARCLRQTFSSFTLGSSRYTKDNAPIAQQRRVHVFARQKYAGKGVIVFSMRALPREQTTPSPSRHSISLVAVAFSYMRSLISTSLRSFKV